jgi:uncharacterized membrane protein (UPF0182 family)
MAHYQIPAPSRRRIWPLVLIGIFILALIGARTIAGYIIEYHWWSEMGQVSTWLSLLAYSLAPAAIVVAIIFVVLFVAHLLGMRFGGARLGHYPLYAKISAAALLLLSIIIGSGIVDTWTVVRYFGGLHLPSEATAWTDPVFGHPLKFYLFDLPFYGVLRQFLLALAIGAALVYWLTARAWQLRDTFQEAFRDRTQVGSTCARSASRARSVRASCAASPPCFCWLWRFAFSWDGTRCCGAITGLWSASTTWMRPGGFRCSGC